ncbi:MAG: Dabb family protein [Myxococcales bacterium]|nr:Dabb family protein [Myxococcales bacterium]
MPLPCLVSSLAEQQRLRAECARVGVATFTSARYQPGLLRHIVLFRYADHVTPADKERVMHRFLALQDECRRDGEPYLLGIETGAQASGEGADHGLEQGFLVTFASAGDRNHYAGTPVVDDPRYFDPAHAAFKELVGPLLAPSDDPACPCGVLVFDFRVAHATYLR